MKSPIRFNELTSSTGEFLHEMNAPDLLRPGRLSQGVVRSLREEQVERLRRNISVLRHKQDEFNRRIDEYVANLEQLILGLERRSSDPAPPGRESQRPRDGDPELDIGTTVRCLRCGVSHHFDGLTVISARESDESLDSPTQCYVHLDGSLRKGVFRCESCGSEALQIRVG